MGHSHPVVKLSASAVRCREEDYLEAVKRLSVPARVVLFLAGLVLLIEEYISYLGEYIINLTPARRLALIGLLLVVCVSFVLIFYRAHANQPVSSEEATAFLVVFVSGFLAGALMFIRRR